MSDDHAALKQLTAAGGEVSAAGWIGRLEASFTSVAIAAVSCVAFLVLMAVYAVPAATSSIAEQLPVSVSQQMADTTLANLDQFLDPSQLESARKQQLEPTSKTMAVTT